MTAKQEEKTAKSLAAYKESLSGGQVKELVKATRELEAYQDMPSSPEDLAKIPLLEREDIGKQGEKLCWTEKQEHGITVLHHNIFTSGIGYLKVLFRTDVVPQEDLYYVGLLKSVLGGVDTEHYSYADLTSEIYLNSGGVDFSVASYGNLKEPEHFTGALVAVVRVLYDRLDFGFEILEEILCRSVSPTAYFNEIVGGTAYFQFLEDVCRNFDAKKEQVMDKLLQVSSILFTRSNLLISYTADEKGYEKLPDSMRKLTDCLPEGSGKR